MFFTSSTKSRSASRFSCPFPTLNLKHTAGTASRYPALNAQGNPGPSDALGRALAAALPSLPDAEEFNLRFSGLGDGAVAELWAAKAAAGSGVQLHL